MEELRGLEADYTREVHQKESALVRLREDVQNSASSNQNTDQMKKLVAENRALKQESDLQAIQLMTLEERVRGSLNELSEKEAAW